MNTREYLDTKVFTDVRVGMRKLLDHIQESGELERYWTIVEKENEEARRAARRLEKERRRLEMGSDYEMSEDEEDTVDQMKLQQSSGKKNKNNGEDSEEYDSEEDQEKSVSKFGGEEEDNFELPFNAVRFLGEALKAISNERKKNGHHTGSYPDDVLFQ